MLSNPSFDEVDLHILRYLVEDATRSHKEIGQLVHLTGQAVGARIRKLQDAGVIEGYTVRWNPKKIGQIVEAFIIVFLQSSDAHQSFLSYVQNNRLIAEAHRVSGEGCYWIKVRTVSHDELNSFLDELLAFGNYKVSLSLTQVK